jgi:hypothetical protein
MADSREYHTVRELREGLSIIQLRIAINACIQSPSLAHTKWSQARMANEPE